MACIIIFSNKLDAANTTVHRKRTWKCILPAYPNSEEFEILCLLINLRYDQETFAYANFEKTYSALAVSAITVNTHGIWDMVTHVCTQTCSHEGVIFRPRSEILLT